ncbi:MAG TPA: hypothetical protein VMC42_06025 [Methanoregulaceae archaeon]|nr:hypothetical protein [Methanoregulaceae archaeon]
MENPAFRLTTLVFLVSLSYAMVFATTPVPVHGIPVNLSWTIKPFCPEFSNWLQNPRVDAGSKDGGSHGLGLIPAPVSLVEGPQKAASGIGMPGTPVLHAPVPAVRGYPFHSAFF